jgi:predicted nucleic acid-binding protein
VNTYAVWCIETTPTEVMAAFWIEDQARIGFWNALIVSSATKGEADRILSEDPNDGQKISGILIQNPFI